jgi:hypothetical protein
VHGGGGWGTWWGWKLHVNIMYGGVSAWWLQRAAQWCEARVARGPREPCTETETPPPRSTPSTQHDSESDSPEQ